MSRRNITLEEGSPLIIYSPPGAWSDGNAADNLLGSYSLNAFRLTTTFNATVSLQFNGYMVLEGPTMGPTSPRLTGKHLSSTVLIQTQTLPGPHTVSLSNAFTDPNAQFLDIDYVILEIPVPDQTTKPVDDSDPSILYTPAAEWSNNTCTDIGDYSSSTCHITSSNVGTIQYAFQGDTITVTGGIGPRYGSYNVLVDGTPRGQFSAQWANHHPSQLLFIASGLGSGNHTLTIQSKPDDVGDIFDLDQIQVFGGNATSLAPPSQTSVSSKKTSLVGPIVGAAVGAVALIVIAVIAVLLYRRRRQRGVKALDLNQDSGPEGGQMQDIIPDPYLGASMAGTSTYPSYPPNSSQWSFHNSSSATNLMDAATELDIGGSEGIYATPVPSTTGVSSNEKFRYTARNPSDGIQPPPYDPGRS
ncbi:hypothetical protein FRB99_006623 [Tulasnella sp. 403]|nr:hypothetical protein FRB99_006623 [Tulasnella sp. 403]